MNGLDSPLEALAFNYLSYGLLTIVNNIWTWVAVLTAAVSFWRIRALSEHPRRKVILGSSQTLLLSSPPEQTCTEIIDNQCLIPSSPPVETTSLCGLDTDGRTKGKFTLYYCNEDESEKCTTSSYHKARLLTPPKEGDKAGEGWWNKWEMVMKIRSGDDEWYSYQDLSLIDGNVVRLWDGCW